jgi:hypothetical protein
VDPLLGFKSLTILNDHSFNNHAYKINKKWTIATSNQKYRENTGNGYREKTVYCLSLPQIVGFVAIDI